MCISPSITAIRRKTRQNTGSEQKRTKQRTAARPSFLRSRIGSRMGMQRHSADRTRLVGGAACRSRQCTPDSYWLPLKWYTPIAAVAALSERLVHLKIMQRKFIGMRLPSLSLRGPEGAVAISQYPAGSQEGRGENATACPRLHPKGTSSRFALRAPRRPLASSQ